jgi:hypothetical protein
MIEAILQGKSLEVFDLSIEFKEAKIPTFKIKIQAYPFADVNALLYQDIAILRDGQELVSGIVAQLPRPEVHLGLGGFLSLQCDTQLGRLYTEMAYGVQFQNVTVAVAIATLLAEAEDSNWALNDTSTLDDEEITLDVRSKETLWAQMEMIRKAAKTPYYLRYAGFSGGSHRLDIGSFGEEVRNIAATQGQNVIGEPKYSQPSRDPLKEIRPISGKVGTKPVALSEALVLEPGLSSDPDYPLDPLRQSVVNNTLSSGRRVRRPFTEIKTENESLPSQTERSQAALALYYKARRELIASNPYIVVRLELALETMPVLYSKIYVDVIARQTVYDPYTQTETLYELLPIQGWFRIFGFSLRGDMKGSIDEKGQLRKMDIYTLELSSGIQEESYSEFELMFNRLEKHDLEDNTGVIIGTISRVPVTVQHSGVAANCNYSGANTGKLFEFPLPQIPAGATGVTAEVREVSDATVDWDIAQDATLSLPLQLCVSGPAAAAWTSLHNVTITIWYSFT